MQRDSGSKAGGCGRRKKVISPLLLAFAKPAGFRYCVLCGSVV
jgi:hypothetical protein